MHLYFTGFTTYMNMVHGVEIPPNQFWYCTIATTVLFISTLSSALFVLSMTFDRFYSIIRPHKAVSFNTVKRAKITIVSIVIFSSLFNIPNVFMTINEERQCVPYVTGIDTVHGLLYYWVSFIINFALPFMLLLIMNSVIIHVIRRSSSFRNKQDAKCDAQSQGHSEGHINSNNMTSKQTDKQVYAILLLVTFGFLILTTPAYVLFLYNMFANYTESPEKFAGFILFYNIAHKMYYTNYGINFFLYVISGRKFRSDLIRLFRRSRQDTKCHVTVTQSSGSFTGQTSG